MCGAFTAPPGYGINMDSYIKWNCYDLAEQMEVFEKCKREFSNIYEELNLATRVIDVKSFEKSEQVRKLQTDIMEIIRRLNIEQNTLEQAIDIYFAAEMQVKTQVETLPISTRNTLITATDVSVTTGNAVLEDWLSALIFRQNQNDV